MAKITECPIKPAAARVLMYLAPHLKIAKEDLGFFCPGCKQPVQPISYEIWNAKPMAPHYEGRFGLASRHGCP